MVVSWPLEDKPGKVKNDRNSDSIDSSFHKIRHFQNPAVVSGEMFPTGSCLTGWNSTCSWMSKVENCTSWLDTTIDMFNFDHMVWFWKPNVFCLAKERLFPAMMRACDVVPDVSLHTGYKGGIHCSNMEQKYCLEFFHSFAVSVNCGSEVSVILESLGS